MLLLLFNTTRHLLLLFNTTRKLSGPPSRDPPSLRARHREFARHNYVGHVILRPKFCLIKSDELTDTDELDRSKKKRERILMSEKLKADPKPELSYTRPDILNCLQVINFGLNRTVAPRRPPPRASNDHR
jgi:hypothetical protein